MFACSCGRFVTPSLADLTDHAKTCPTVGPSYRDYQQRLAAETAEDAPTVTVIPDRKPLRRLMDITREEWQSAYDDAVAKGWPSPYKRDFYVAQRLGIGVTSARTLRHGYDE